VRAAISVLLIWHLSGVFLAALSVQPSSPLVANIAQRPPMQWYLDLLYLNHGHYFFAPDPGPGHLIRYELFDERGEVIERAEFPNTKDQWPRLRYHRHFMLADQAGLPSDDEAYRRYWERLYLESYARHLLRVNDEAQSVRLARIVHWPLPRRLFQEGRKLDDPEGYQTSMEVVQRRSDVEPAVDRTDAAQADLRQGRFDSAGHWVGGVR